MRRRVKEMVQRGYPASPPGPKLLGARLSRKTRGHGRESKDGHLSRTSEAVLRAQCKTRMSGGWRQRTNLSAGPFWHCPGRSGAHGAHPAHHCQVRPLVLWVNLLWYWVISSHATPSVAPKWRYFGGVVNTYHQLTQGNPWQCEWASGSQLKRLKSKSGVLWENKLSWELLIEFPACGGYRFQAWEVIWTNALR